jgi:hypothetical protein
MIARTFTVALFAAVFLAGALQAGPTDGLIGRPLAAAEASELFTFFNLAQTAKLSCGGGRALGFRPTGARFHRLAGVEVVTDAKGAVAAMTLTLDRPFIDDPVNGVFARDLAKSFLGDVPAAAAKAGVVALAGEIEAGMSSSSATVVLRPEASPAAPKGPPSPGYSVFLGNQGSWALKSGGETTSLANGRQGGEAVLRLSLSRGGAAPACAMGAVAD